jgi:hypothetical protein
VARFGVRLGVQSHLPAGAAQAGSAGGRGPPRRRWPAARRPGSRRPPVALRGDEHAGGRHGAGGSRVSPDRAAGAARSTWSSGSRHSFAGSPGRGAVLPAGRAGERYRPRPRRVSRSFSPASAFGPRPRRPTTSPAGAITIRRAKPRRRPSAAHRKERPRPGRASRRLPCSPGSRSPRGPEARPGR